LTESSRAVFLSYASQDAQAAQHICEALRAAGIEVWFDQSELRGGDAWDRKIREQIRDCRLFIPVISAHSEERDEGYFRREWKLAVDRTHDMADRKAFLVPVVVDGTSEKDSSVPEKFRELQWTRLLGGETGPDFIERIKRLLSSDGTRLAGPASAPGGGVSHDAASRGLARRRALVLRGAAAAAALLAAVLGFFAVEWIGRQKPVGQAAVSIAVLPLANESGEANDQYFSDGISEDLITALSQLPGLKVIGRSSAFKFRDSKEDSRSIGSKLGVAHLLEGSVRKSGDMVRVSAELIDAADGSTQWSQRYDRPYKDLFALQDEITHAVAGALKTRLLPGSHTTERNERPPGGSLEAYDAMLQGRFYALRGSEADIRKAIEYNTRAISLDPKYALAWSNLSIDWSGLGASFFGGAAAQEAFAKARDTSAQALAIAPDLAQAHVARGNVLQWADFDWRGAQAEYRRALELAPDEGRTKISLGLALASLGEVKQAIELQREALATDPLRAGWYRQLALYLIADNRLDEAERAIRRAMELQPSSTSHYEELTVIEVERGDAAAALAAAQQTEPGVRQAVALAFASQIGADRSAADTALRTLIDKYAGDAAVQIAEVYALRNDPKAAFEWLDRAWSIRDPGVSEIFYGPFIPRYRGDPRFAAFCRKVGLSSPKQGAAGTST
jgi:TolB-like protein/Tfp pilus assembly protein PilF